jgi:hypothetical protein
LRYHKSFGIISQAIGKQIAISRFNMELIKSIVALLYAQTVTVFDTVVNTDSTLSGSALDTDYMQHRRLLRTVAAVVPPDQHYYYEQQQQYLRSRPINLSSE